MGSTRVVVVENDYGVGKTWFMQNSSAAGAPYGLVGALVSAGLDAMMNYGPSKRASQAADEIAVVMPVDALNASLTGSLLALVPADDAGAGVTFSAGTSVQRLAPATPEDDAIEVAATYWLSEDATTLMITITASYSSEEIPYVTPYTFEDSPPKAELSGPTYRNTFVYYSAHLPVPELTPELQQELIASIENSARDESGALPAEGTDEYRAMTRELEEARDNKLTRAEISIFLTREWLKDDGRLIRAEVDNAHALASRYLLLDLNQTAVPTFEGEGQELVETLPDGRTVSRISGGLMAGSYVSAPADFSPHVAFGNAINHARVHLERMKTLRDAARSAR